MIKGLCEHSFWIIYKWRKHDINMTYDLDMMIIQFEHYLRMILTWCSQDLSMIKNIFKYDLNKIQINRDKN